MMYIWNVRILDKKEPRVKPGENIIFFRKVSQTSMRHVTQCIPHCLVAFDLGVHAPS